ncbi:hypothetical protein AHAS_Ahas18G0251600 [Arachis hypogaea]
MVNNNSSQPNDWCWVNTNLGVEDLDSSMERLSLSIMSQEKSAAANSVDPREYTLTPFTLEEASSEHGNQNVMNNYNNGAIVQGALLTSSHDYNGFNSIEQETHDVGESVAQRLQGIRGHVVTLARDQYGCRFLQAMIDDGIPQEIDMILDEVEDHTHELMTHHFAARAYLHERPRPTPSPPPLTPSKKKNKANNNNNNHHGANGEDTVLITPVPRFPDKSDDTAEKVELSEDRMVAGSTKGYRMVRPTRGVVEGAWYFEIRVLHLGETGHTRLGWSTEKGDLQAPVGYDGNSFGYRDIDGSKVHKALREKIFLLAAAAVAWSSGGGPRRRCFFFLVMVVRKRRGRRWKEIGTRVAQKMLTSLRDPVQIAYTVRRLMYITVPLLKNANGGYVIQQCVRVFTESCQKVIFDEIARNCVDVATDKKGCSVIQKCMAHGAGVPILLLVKSIILNSGILSADPFGNYVVQYIIKRNILEPPVTKMIVQHLRGRYAELSMNRHASHVIEVLFRHSDPTDVAIIIMELVNSPDFVNLLRHYYGNYVAQRALQFSTGVTHRTLVHRILSNYAYLHAHPYGERVLTCIKGIRWPA